METIYTKFKKTDNPEDLWSKRYNYISYESGFVCPLCNKQVDRGFTASEETFYHKGKMQVFVVCRNGRHEWTPIESILKEYGDNVEDGFILSEMKPIERLVKKYDTANK